MKPHIRISNLNAYYGNQHVLKNVNLEIPRNSLTVVLGPSGCGKTTLMKCLNRFLDLEYGSRVTGKIEFDGVDLYDPQVDPTQVRKKIGLLAQRPFPLPMSIYDNVAYGLRIHRMLNRSTLNQTVEHYLQMAGLWEEVKDRLHTPAGELSIGQQQRLCLARGLAVEPEIILGDEPTSALDPISAQFIEKRLVELKKHYTIILVTHILRQARRLADHVVFMYLGEVVESGTAEEVFNHPKQERTRSYFAGEI